MSVDAIKAGRVPHKKPEGGKSYSSSLPANSGGFQTKDQRLLCFQLKEEILKALEIGFLDVDRPEARKIMCDRLYNSVEALKTLTEGRKEQMLKIKSLSDSIFSNVDQSIAAGKDLTLGLYDLVDQLRKTC